MDRIMCEFRRKIAEYRKSFKEAFGLNIDDFCYAEDFNIEKLNNINPPRTSRQKFIVQQLMMTPMKFKDAKHDLTAQS